MKLKEAKKIVAEFNEQNRYGDFGRINTAIKMVLAELEKREMMIHLMAEKLIYNEDLKCEVCRKCSEIKQEICGEPKKNEGYPIEEECVIKFFGEVSNGRYRSNRV